MLINLPSNNIFKYKGTLTSGGKGEVDYSQPNLSLVIW